MKRTSPSVHSLWIGGFLLTLATTGYGAVNASPEFDRIRGWQTAPLILQLGSATPGVAIWYTLDGSPPSATNGVRYGQPLSIARTTVVRARAESPGADPSPTVTHTYLFLPDILLQTKRPIGWPASWGENKVDYGLDPRITTMSPWREQLPTAFAALPVVALSLARSDLFNSKTGIYANPREQGRDWERPVGVEIIAPDGQSVSANAGLRVRGGFSRDTANPKHSLRLFFRLSYGDASLKFPRTQPPFADFGLTDTKVVTEFDRLDLRTAQDGSWAFQGDPYGLWINDSFARDTQIAMAQLGEHGHWAHVFLNGIYWGLYELVERPESHFAADYLGGAAADYDVVKVDPDSNYQVVPTDGNLDSWRELWRAATNGFASRTDYFRVQGRGPNGAVDPAIPPLLEVTNLVDYLLTIAWTGNYDGPIFGSLTDGFPNNFFALRRRDGTGGGFRFVTHDSELTLRDLQEDRTGLSTIGSPAKGDGPERMTPHYLWSRLRENSEFRQLVADRIQRHFFNGGALTTEVCLRRFRARVAEIGPALVAESARWGDANRAGGPILPTDWESVVQDRLADYLPWRTEVVLAQLSAQNLWTGPIPRRLEVNRNDPDVEVSWMDDASGRLTRSLDGGRTWQVVTGTIYDRYGFKLLQVSPAGTAVLYRLRP